MILNGNEIIASLKPRQVFGMKTFTVKNVQIDTRNIEIDSAFFAFIGEHSDGHNFIQHASKNGASCVVCSYIPDNLEPYLEKMRACILVVDDVLEALHNMARLARSKMSAKVIAVTGSLGKTTTKDMIGDILSKFYLVSISSGNKNNHIGMPMSLINADPKSNVVVLEMGMNHLGEIAMLSKIAKPDIAIITTIAPAHVGNFQSVEEIADAKSEIFQGMSENGIVILNQDNKYYSQLVQNAKNSGIKTIIGLGLKGKSPIYIDNYKISLSNSKYDLICKTTEGEEIIACSIPSISHHAAYNTIFVFALAKLLKLDLKEVQKIVAKFKGVDGRGNIETIMSGKRKIIVINDCYNASPESVKSSIVTLSSVASEYPQYRAICVLGDMLELGKFSQEYHEGLAEILKDAKIAKVFTVGQEMKYLYDKLPENMRAGHFENAQIARRPVRDGLMDGDIVLFKASRGVALETIIEKLYQA